MKIINPLILLIFSVYLASDENFEFVRKIEQSTFQINIYKTIDEKDSLLVNGSAVLINKKEDIYFFITNAHVVLEAACVVVSYVSECEDGESDEWPEDVNLYVTHPWLENEYLVYDYIYWEDVDFAVLAVEMLPYKSDDELYDEYLKEIKPIKFAPNYINLTDKVYAAGYPSVLGNNSEYKEIFITSGIINSFIITEKSLEETGQYNLVHDAVIKGGMSGGPLVNERGELVGINGLVEASFSSNNSDCYSWFCFFHSHSEINDFDIGKFSYAIDSDWLLWSVFSDPNRFLFEDPSMQGYLPKFSKKKYSKLYEFLKQDADYLEEDLDFYFN